MKKRIPTSDEIANDPSLKYCPYRKGEAVWSETHQQEFRFYQYENDGSVRLATLAGIAPMDETVAPLTIRRLTSRRPNLMELVN